MSVVYFLYLPCSLITVQEFKDADLEQYCGTVGVFNNRKFSKKLQHKEVSKLKFIQTCFIADYLYFFGLTLLTLNIEESAYTIKLVSLWASFWYLYS